VVQSTLAQLRHVARGVRRGQLRVLLSHKCNAT
jgi:hypothetical protein